MLRDRMLKFSNWVVVGASQDPGKFGNQIYRRLKQCGYQVAAVNPNYQVIDGDPCYPNLSVLPTLPDVLNLVVNPHLSALFLEEAARLGIHYIWFQPGTYNDAVLAHANMLGLEWLCDCVLVATDHE